VRRELLLYRGLAPGDKVVVVADADDLDGPVEQPVVRGTIVGWNWTFLASFSAWGASGSVAYDSVER
jgi:hypothetical protein